MVICIIFSEWPYLCTCLCVYVKNIETLKAIFCNSPNFGSHLRDRINFLSNDDNQKPETVDNQFSF